MERIPQVIDRTTYVLTFAEVRTAIHDWLDEVGVCVPVGVPLTLSEEGAVLVWENPRHPEATEPSA